MAALGAPRRLAASSAVLLAIAALTLVEPLALAQAPTGGAPPDSASRAPVRSSADNEIDAQRRELESLKQQLDERRRTGQALKGREKSILVQLRESEKNLQLTVRYLAALEKRRRVVASSLGDATTELVRTAAQLETDRRRLAWRLREIYKRGRSADLEYLLSARSFGDLVTRTYYLARIAQEDRGQVLLTQARRGQVQDTKTRLESRKRELDRLKAETDRERVSLNQIRIERRNLLKKIRPGAGAGEQADPGTDRGAGAAAPGRRARRPGDGTSAPGGL
jgi:septal ring factor EnvC (AmiA/AmiB activator)